MVQRVNVGQVMNQSISWVDCQCKVRDVARQMAEQDIGSLLVKKDEEVVGIITEMDLVRRVLAKNQDPDAVAVEAVMSAPVYAIEEHESLEKARQRMTGHAVQHLLVTREGQPVGMVSSRNLLDLQR